MARFVAAAAGGAVALNEHALELSRIRASPLRPMAGKHNLTR
jgi:hypothetical protein